MRRWNYRSTAVAPTVPMRLDHRTAVRYLRNVQQPLTALYGLSGVADGGF